jgi:hypothetical protein
MDIPHFGSETRRNVVNGEPVPGKDVRVQTDGNEIAEYALLFFPKAGAPRLDDSDP